MLTPASQRQVPWGVEHLVSAGDRLVASRKGGTLLGFLPSGRQAWVRELEGLGEFAPLRWVSMGGNAFIESDPVLRIDARTGRTLASRSFGANPFLGAHSGSLLCRSRTDERLHALDAETLATWASCADPEGRIGLHEGYFCETTAERVIVLRDPETGLELARVPEPEDARHVHYRQSVCLFSASERVAIDVGSGRELWRHPMAPAWAEGTRVLIRWRDQVLVYGSGLSAFDLATGEPRWRALEGRTDLRPWWGIVEGRVLFDSGSTVHVVDASTGELVGSHDVGLTISTATLAPGGQVAVVGWAKAGGTELHVLQIEPKAP